MSKPNRLIDETSPYLLQHAHNPVDWYPWGEEALRRAKLEGRPIFLSIGYSACHWCHVMEKESFEDAATAKLMNELFINIKVDREERPDLDHIYMAAVQMMTQHGGWPMSVFLTPELQPFYGGTYFPPEDRMGMPSFKKILSGVANAWKTRKDEIVKTAAQLSQALIDYNEIAPSTEKPSLGTHLVDNAAGKAAQNFDPVFGGFGNAPKFFHTMDLRLCLRHWKRTGDARSLAVVNVTLDKLLSGGIYDQLAGGFHRYSTDREWLAPHFEKMLYDNALLSETYLEAFLAVPQKDEWARIARETLNYVLREMTSPEGGFYSTQDADSEGEEGKFYVWSKAEVEQLLDPDVAKVFNAVFDVTPEGNWEGKTILRRTGSLDEWAAKFQEKREWVEDQLALASRKLLAQRTQRIPPLRDDKVLASWNGMMIHSMAMGYRVCQDSRYLEAAKRAAQFICEKMVQPGTANWSLYHTYKDGKARVNGLLDDYACFGNAVLTLLEVDPDPKWLKLATAIGETLLDQFWESSDGSFYYTPKNHEALLTRPRELTDGATPSATSMAITFLIRLGLFTGKGRYLQRAEASLATLGKALELHPNGFGQALIATELMLNSPEEWVLYPGENEEENENILSEIWRRFRPGIILLVVSSKNERELTKYTELLDGRSRVGAEPTLFICRKMVCEAPLIGIQAIEKRIQEK